MELVFYQLLSGVDTFLNLLSLMLVVYALMTWFMRPDNKIYQVFARMADFVISPFRPISAWLIRQGFRIDVSVILALICIRILRTLLFRLMW